MCACDSVCVVGVVREGGSEHIISKYNFRTGSVGWHYVLVVIIISIINFFL